MNIIAEGLYPELQKLAASGYSGPSLDSWRNGKLVKVIPLQKLTLAQAAQLNQVGILTIAEQV